MKYCFFKIISSLILMLTLSVNQHSQAQSIASSPYSRYAFGDLSANPHSSFFGLSGLSISLCDSFQFNSYNPASYSFILNHRPIFDFGIGGEQLVMTTTSAQAQTTTFGLRGISLGIPVSKKWGASFGITPVSSVGYSFVTHEIHPVIGDITYKYDGKGGLNRLYVGTSYMPVKRDASKLSLGMNLAYVFGSLQNSSRAIYDGQSISTGLLHSKVVTNTFISDFILEGGILYRGKMNKNTYLNVGANINAGASLYAKREKLAYTFDNLVSESLVDTVEYQESEAGNVFFPKKLGFGTSVERRIQHRDNLNAFRRLVFSAQYELQDWGKYSEIFDGDTVADGMRNSRSFAFGIQYNPYSSSIIGPDEKWWMISTYRFAFNGANTYLQIDSTQIMQYGISFGIGVPLINSLSFSLLNIGVEAGKRGNSKSGLIQESYIRINLGLTIAPHRNDLWFLKRKYD